MQDCYDLRREPGRLVHIGVCRYSYTINPGLKDERETHRRLAFMFESDGNEIVLNIRQINEVQQTSMSTNRERPNTNDNLITFELDRNENFTDVEFVCGIAGTLKSIDQRNETFRPINANNNREFVPEEFEAKCKEWTRHYSHLNPNADFGY